MARIRGQNGDILSDMLLVCLFIVVSAHISDASSWYQGCYLVNDTTPQVAAPMVTGSETHPVHCGIACTRSRFPYVAINARTGCQCWDHLQPGLVPRENCTATCGGSPPGSVALPCGDTVSAEFWSVYTTAGPYVSKVEVTSPASAYLGHPISIQITVSMAGDPDLDLGVPELPGVNTAVLMVHGTGADAAYVDNPTAGSTTVTTVWQPLLNRQGIYHLTVSVSNDLSSHTTSVTLNVTYPTPTDLSLTLITNSMDLPSCVPDDIRRRAAARTASTRLVYRGVRLHFEALVSVGVNLTFDWSLVKLPDSLLGGSEAVIHTASMACEGPCRSKTLEYTFVEIAEYRIDITVRHLLGQLTQELYVVALDPDITNMSVQLTSDGSATAITPNQTTTFVVSMETTTKKDLVLVVDYDDGTVTQYQVQDLGGQSSQPSTAQPNPEQHLLAPSSFSDDCILSVEVSRVYLNEGHFSASFVANNPHSNLSVVADTLIVQNQLKGPSIPARTVGAVGVNVTIEVSLEQWSANRTIEWTFSPSLLEHDDPKVIPDHGPELTHVFPAPGLYLVAVRVQNKVNYVEAGGVIQILVAVEGLALTHSGVHNYFNVSQDVRFNALVTAGTDVAFTWDFHDGNPGSLHVVTEGKSSSVLYSFEDVGEYRVTVQAYNEYNQLEYTLDPPINVLEPVGNLMIQGVNAVAKGHNITYSASTSSGTSVRFHFDFGWGPIEATQRTGKNQVVMTHMFDAVGKVNVTVYARNEVSAASQEVTTEVQEVVPDMVLRSVFAPIQREQIVFVVESNGSPLRRPDIVLTWLLDGNHQQMTASPLFNLSFEERGPYNMTVHGKNLVSEKQTFFLFNVTAPPSSESRFTQAPIVIKGQQKTFSIVNIPAGPLKVNVRYQLGSKVIENNLEDPDGRSFSWPDSFTETGLYSLEAHCEPETGPLLTISSWMIVEEPITGLTLSGPKAVAMTGSKVKHRWIAHMSGGSHVVYTWKQGSNITKVSTCRMNHWEFAREGTYILRVTANNILGSVVKYTNVTVQRPITELHVTSTTTVTGRTVDMDISLSGGPPFTFEVNYGDGNTSRISSLDNHTLTVLETPDTEFGFRVKYQYSVAGQHTLTVSASNLVSQFHKSTIVTVEEQISGLEVMSADGALVATGVPITVTASVATGNDLRFTFDFGEERRRNLPSCNKSYTIQYTYQQPGLYRIHVSVSNAYQVVPIHVTLAYEIQVIVPMSGLGLQRTRNQHDCVRLYKRSTGNFSTETLGFEARVDSGSDVTFTVDFGDGVVDTKAGTMRGFPLDIRLYATFNHTYTTADEFVVRVTASNPLETSSLTSPKKICVQIIPSGVQLNEQFYKTLYPGPTVFQATFKGGTLLEFDWTLGDGTVFHREASEISHTYSSPNKYDVVVMARNRVGQENSSAIVYVQARLMGVDLSVSSLVHQVGTPVEFRASADPDHPHGVLHYKWDVDGTVRRTASGVLSYVFSNSGKYSVSVTAENYQGNVTSDPIVVEALSLISELTVAVRGEMVIAKGVVFDVYHFHGSEVTYTWTFEPNRIVQTTRREVDHSFAKGGEYQVTVVASNALSKRVATVTVFITRTYCNIPQVTMLGNVQKFQRSTEIHVETEVKINCSLTDKTLYTWAVYEDPDYQKRMILDGVTEQVFHDSFLYLPPRTLPYGKYYLLLNVSMEGQIVRTNKTKDIEVTPSPMMSIIRGGIQRLANRNETLVLNGTLSYDPDFPEDSDLMYLWTCYVLITPELPCFKADAPDVLSSNESVVYVPGQNFMPLEQAFVFNLTVCRGDRQPSSVSQVVRLEGTAVVDANILCVQCQMGIINVDERLVLETVHSNFREDQLQYTWSFQVVIDGSDALLARVHDKGKCVMADNSTYHKYTLANTTTTAITATTTAATGPTTPTTTMEAAQTITTVPTTAATVPTPATTTSAPSDSGLPISEGTGRGSGRGTGRSGGFPIFVEGGSDPRAPLPPNPGPPSVGGIPLLGEGDSNSGRPIFPSEGDLDGGREDPTPDRGTQGGERDTAVDGEEPIRSEMNIVSRLREDVWIGPEDTTTGMGGRILVLREGVLEQGRTYMVGVTVRHKESGVEGNALTYFRVNQSPIIGKCRMTPDVTDGTEMETTFNVFCEGWQDTELPISYMVSYSSHNDQTPDLIYQGLNTETTFQLPAGNPSNDFKVKIHISILDGLGAKTTVCSIETYVRPKEFVVSNRTEEEILYDLVEEDGSTLQTFIQRGDNRNARLHAHMVASRLNRLQPSTTVGSQGWREKTRRAMLWALKDLPIRNQYEIQQMTSAVATTTAVTEELNDESMNYTADILQKASSQMLSMATITKGTDEGNAMHVLQGASNILYAIAREPASTLRTDMAREIVERSNQVVQTLMKASVNHLVTGEAAIEKRTDVLYTMAGRYKTSAVPNLTTNDAIFVLPSNLKTVLNIATVKEDVAEEMTEAAGLGRLEQPERSMLEEDCYQAHMVTYKENPYKYGTEPDMIQTQVASLTLLSCQGHEIIVENLTETDVIDIVLPHRPVQDKAVTYTLNRHQMNIHEFNLTESNVGQSLHIDVSLVPTDKGRLFPIAVLLRENQIPTPDLYLKKWTEFGVDKNNFTITVDAGSLEEGATYYIGLVDAAFNEGRPREGELKEREYRLKLWWGQCLYWNSHGDQWSPDGCSIKSSSSYYEAHCSCKHLSSFGAHLSLAPNDLDFTNVDDFFNLNENPVTFSLIVTLFIVYAAAMIICVRKDQFDENKSPVVPLVDNTYKDRQVYIITLETGFRKGAGTTAKVSLVLHGQEGMSQTRELLSDKGETLFDRNSRDTFIMTLPESLGHIFKLQIWHNNAGTSPGWFLSRATVRDAVSGKVYFFICEKWLAVEEEDEKVEREIMVTEQGLGFRKMVWAKSTQLFADYHLWFSTVTRPSYSRFTRAQRITCCLSLLMSYMAVNAAWYRSTEKEYRGEFGLIDLSWRSLIVGMITSVIVLPINYIIVLLFRRSKIQKPRPPSDNTSEQDFKSSNKRHSLSSIASAARILQPVMSQSIFDQTIVNWQSLQQWAQKTWAKRHSEMTPDSGSQDMKPLRSDEVEEVEELGEKDALSSPEGSGHSLGGSSVEAETSFMDDGREFKEEKPDISRDKPSHSSPVALDSTETTDSTKLHSQIRGQISSTNSHPDPLKAKKLPRTPQKNPDLASAHPLIKGVSAIDQTQGPGSKGQGQLQGSQDPGQSPEGSPGQRSTNGQSSHGRSPSGSQASQAGFTQDAQERSHLPREGHSQEGSCQGSPRSERSTAMSDLSCSTPSSGKTAARIPRSTPRSQWSVTRSDFSGPPPINVRTRRSRCVFLPGSCRYVAWILAFVVIAGCAAVTVLYGFRFGRVKSIQWLQSLFFSAVQCIFITHPILIILTSVCMAIRYKNDLTVFDTLNDDLVEDKVKVELANISPKVKDEESEFSEGMANRQRSRYLRFARPPQEKQLLEARNKTIKEKKASAVFSETTIFTIQFLLLLFMAFGKSQELVFTLNKTLSLSFTSSGDPSFNEIKTVPDWWNWSQTSLLDTLYWEAWYNGQPTESERGYIENSVLVGHVHLRQLRISEQPCHLPPPYTHVTPRCRYEYSKTTKSITAFGHNTTWWHMHHEFTGAHDFGGKHSDYDGDGFLVLLSADRSEAKSQLQFLQAGRWIDKLTRAIIIEFTLFHPQTSLFTSVKLLTELPPMGGVTKSHQVASVYLYKYQTPFDNFILACELFFIIITFLRLHKIVLGLLNSKEQYLKYPWHWCHITQGLLSLVFVVCYVYRFILIWDTVDRMRASYHETYVDVAHVEQWDDILRSLIGFISCLYLLQLLKALRHRKPFAVFENVFRHAAIDIAVCGVIFLIWICAYTCLGIALYASVSPFYSSPGGALLATTGLFTGIYKSVAETDVMDFWGVIGLHIFTASFMVFALGFLSAYIMAVLNFHYKVYRHEVILVFNTKESVLYYWERFLFFFGLKHPVLPEEDDTILPPEYTMAELEYQVDEMLFKMNALTGSSNLPEKPPMYFTDSDATYGVGEDGLSSGGSEVRGYDDERLGTRIHKIEENLLSYEPHLAQLIQLDTIGTDILAHEQEKNLRSQLELEIFRQLQMRRNQLPGMHRQLSATNSGSTGYQASISHSSSNSSRGGLLVNDNSQEQLPGYPGRGVMGEPEMTQEKDSALEKGKSSETQKGNGYQSPCLHPNKLLQNKLSFPKPPKIGKRASSNTENSGHNTACQSTGTHTVRPPTTDREGRPPDHETLQDLDPQQLAIVKALARHGINDLTGAVIIPLGDLKVSAPSSHTRKGSDNTGSEASTHDDVSATSSSSGGTEVHQVMQKKPQQHTKHDKQRDDPDKFDSVPGMVQPKHAHSRFRTRSAEKYRGHKPESHVRERLGYSLPRQGRYNVNRDSDDDRVDLGGALHKSRSHGRGKGAGPSSHIEEFAFDNDGFDSDPEVDKSKNKLRR